MAIPAAIPVIKEIALYIYSASTSAPDNNQVIMMIRMSGKFTSSN